MPDLRFDSFSKVVIHEVQTAAVGSNWVAFPSDPCSSLDLINETGSTIEYRRNGDGTAAPVATGVSRRVVGITNANQISVRRKDLSNTQVTVQAETYA